jgi:hypothetical protein
MSGLRESFRAAAVRHLDDAQILLHEARWDGAVHLAGFAAECAMKFLLKRALPGYDGRDSGHKLDALGGSTSAWVAAVTGDRDLSRLTEAVRSGDDLALDHPARRYDAPWWTEHRAKAVVDHARRLVRERVVGPSLDRGDSLRCP